MSIDLEQRIRGGIWGLLVGDALGVPYEFHPPAALPEPAKIDFSPPAGFVRSHAGVLPGTWSDDGAHALCLLDSLLARRGLDLEDLAARLVNWYEHGYLAVDCLVFDVGNQTASALLAYRGGTPAAHCGGTAAASNGNGSLMRVLPLALWHTGSDRDLIDCAFRQSQVTHGHLRSRLCCALYCLWARNTLMEREDAYARAVGTLRDEFTPGMAEREEFEAHIRPDDEAATTGSGYVVDCLRSARRANQEASFSAVVKAAVAMGNDTDTTACVAGGIAGIRFGVEAIPLRWRQALRGQDLFAELLDALVAHRCASGSSAECATRNPPT